MLAPIYAISEAYVERGGGASPQFSKYTATTVLGHQGVRGRCDDHGEQAFISFRTAKTGSARRRLAGPLITPPIFAVATAGVVGVAILFLHSEAVSSCSPSSSSCAYCGTRWAETEREREIFLHVRVKSDLRGQLSVRWLSSAATTAGAQFVFSMRGNAAR